MEELEAAVTADSQEAEQAEERRRWRQSGDVRVLVCEGACNRGEVRRYDEFVRQSIGTSHTASLTLAIHPRVLEMAREFRHTPHVPTGRYDGTEYQCQVCGTLRAYGSSPSRRIAEMARELERRPIR
jgi:hypothetical protein